MFMARHERSARHRSARTASGRQKRCSRARWNAGTTFTSVRRSGRAPGQPRQGRRAFGQALLISRELTRRAPIRRGTSRNSPPRSARTPGTAAARGRPSPCSRSPPGIRGPGGSRSRRLRGAADRRAHQDRPRVGRGGSTLGAIGLLHEVVGMYLKAPAADEESATSAWRGRASPRSLPAQDRDGRGRAGGDEGRP